MNDAKILSLVLRPVAPDKRLRERGRVEVKDLYDLPQVDLTQFSGLILGMSVDQVFLKKSQAQLDDFVAQGGRVLVNGHPVLPFISGMPEWRKLMFHGVTDIWLTELQPHPIWAGIDRKDLLFRTGVPGEHEFEKLKEIGVAGFYARSFMVNLPDNAVPITGIGPGKLPVDVAWNLGQGEVVIHAGNDLLSFTQAHDSTCNLTENALNWLEAK